MRKTILPLALILLTGCYFDKEDQLYPKPTGKTCDTTGLTYAAHIKPIIDQYCATATCHDNVTQAYTYDMSKYEGVKLAVDGERLLGAIRQETGFYAMPKGLPKLTDCEMAKITAWVNAGAPQ